MMSEKQEKNHRINGIRIGYTDKKITSYGGYSMLAIFFEKINLKSVLNTLMPIEEVSPNAMSGSEKLLGFMSTVIAGGQRFSHVMYLGDQRQYKLPADDN